MSRIRSAFDRLARERRTGLITYVTAGDPDMDRTRRILPVLDRAGADVIELGVPFSDPIADGPVIQRASERALSAGATLASTLDLVASIRHEVRSPLVLFTYANPVFRMGLGAFASRAAAAGVDGVLALDVPIEESDDLRAALQQHRLDMIVLLSPTTSSERMALAAQVGTGFLYVISRLGVTGARPALAGGTADLVARIRRATALPVAVGFGVSRPEHVREVGQWAEAAVVGSALVQAIADSADAPDFEERIAGFVGWLRGADAGPGVAEAGARG